MKVVYFFIIPILLSITVNGQVVSKQSTNLDNDYYVPGDNLSLDGIPKIPKSLSRIYDNFFEETTFFELQSWAASGKEIRAFPKGRRSILSIISKPGVNGEELLRFNTEGRTIYGLYFDRQGKNLIYNAELRGDELYQLFYYEPATKKSIQLTENGSRNVWPVWSHNGKYIAWGSSLNKDEQGMNIDVIDPLNPNSMKRILLSTGTALQVADWSPDDRAVIYVEYISRNTNSRIWKVDVSSSKKELLLPLNDKEINYYGNPCYSPDGNRIYFVTDKDSEFRRLATYDLKNKSVQYLSIGIDWDVETFGLAPNGETIVLVTNENGISKLRLLDTKTNKFSKPINTPLGKIGNVIWNNNSIDVAFNLETPRTYQNIYVFNVLTKDITCWSKLNETSDKSKEFPIPKAIEWKSFDNRFISGFIYRPNEISGKLPVLIEIHGGPDIQYRPSYNPENNLICNMLGVAKIYPNIRGSFGYGKTFLTLDDGIKRMDALKDIYHLIKWVKKQPDLDGDKISVVGYSAGAYMALLVASNYSNEIRSAIAGYGPSNLVSLLEDKAKWNVNVSRIEYGDISDPAIRAELNRVAPRNNVDEIKIPMLIIHGANDPRIPISESASIVDLLKANRKTVWYLVGKNEGHGFIHRDTGTFKAAVVITFLKQYLLAQ